MELTDSFRALVTSTCEKLKGTDKRTFMADVAQQIASSGKRVWLGPGHHSPRADMSGIQHCVCRRVERKGDKVVGTSATGTDR